MHGRAFIITGAAVLVTLAAPSHARGQAPRTTGEQRSPACDLLTTEDVNKATGRQDYGAGTTGDMPGEGIGGGTSCQWDGKDLTSEAPLVSAVLVPLRKDGQHYVGGGKPTQGCTFERVPGVGEEAYFDQCPKPISVTLFVKTRGANDLIVDVRLAGKAPDAVKPAVVALAKAALAKVK